MTKPTLLTRRTAIRLGLAGAAGALAARFLPSASWAAVGQTGEALLTKPIPSTGERLPLIGVGTLGEGYRNPTPESRERIRATLARLVERGASVVDTAPAYGGSEALLGELIAELGLRDRIFLATKVGADGLEAGRAMIENSFRQLRVERLDLLAIHSLTDWRTQLPTLRALKDEGRIRYLGITTSRGGQNEELEAIMRTEPLDFVQVTYAVDDREVEETFLPLAADRGVAVMTNLSLGRGRLFERVEGVALPDWAEEIDCRSWAQFFLKYVVSHPAVTCAIPGMSRVEHCDDNLEAAWGRLPDAAERQRMAAFIDALPA